MNLLDTGINKENRQGAYHALCYCNFTQVTFGCATKEEKSQTFNKFMSLRSLILSLLDFKFYIK